MNQLTKLLLSLFVTFFTLTLGLGGYLALHWAEMRGLEARLLSHHELQKRLLSGRVDDQVLYPHASRAVGYVLNPHMEKSSWRAAEGETYSINSLGLRGPEIAARRKGVVRVALVGDSMFFGWRLRDADIVAARLNAIVQERLGREVVEFVTIALPGWNVTSERAFLDHHLDVIDPDVVLWSIIGNDLDDVVGAVPPGIMAQWASPQKDALNPVVFASNFVREVAMPSVMERWDGIARNIQSFAAQTGIATVVVWWRANEERNILYRVLARNHFAPPLVVVPRRYRYDERWYFSNLDVHPTPWATEILAAGILGRLIDLDLIPPLERSTAEQEIADAFRSESSYEPSARDINERLSARLGRVALAYDEGQWRGGSDSTLYGLDEGDMLASGTIFLRNEDASDHVRIRLEAPGSSIQPPGLAISASVVDRRARVSEATFSLTAGANEFVLDVPGTAPRSGVFEIGWRFEPARCETPSRCRSARLVEASFTR